MSKIGMRGAEASADWNDAWQVVAQLAEVRATTLRDMGAPGTAAVPVSHLIPDSSAAAAPPILPDQLARDMAEIERAARALRRAEPTLEPSPPATEASAEMRGVRSIWLLLGIIWLAALLVVACGAATLALLLG